MAERKPGVDPERDWKEWPGPEGQIPKETHGPVATIPEDEEIDYGAPDNRGTLERICDAVLGGEDTDRADQNQGKSV